MQHAHDWLHSALSRSVRKILDALRSLDEQAGYPVEMAPALRALAESMPLRGA